jgi:hypothetical protein
MLRKISGRAFKCGRWVKLVVIKGGGKHLLDSESERRSFQFMLDFVP